MFLRSIWFVCSNLLSTSSTSTTTGTTSLKLVSAAGTGLDMLVGFLPIVSAIHDDQEPRTRTFSFVLGGSVLAEKYIISITRSV